jgi:hypothetical protein|tara:strand:- start:816 stop:1070 length:255 start_codon:yes stop_codon:yes gene_type:complete
MNTKITAREGGGNFLAYWVPIGAVLVAVGAAFSAGAVYSQLSTQLQEHVSRPAHAGTASKYDLLRRDISELKAMVARIDERTRR